MKAKRHINNEQWLLGVRHDLDSKHEVWAVKTRPSDISKLECIGSYLDIILTELGYPGALHDCPECGVRHLGERA